MKLMSKFSKMPDLLSLQMEMDQAVAVVYGTSPTESELF